jgi:RND family efflux transporter MFP subunit
MRGRKFIAICLVLVLIILAATACNTGSAGSQQQQVQVTKGDLVIRVNGSGTIGVDSDSKPSFGSGGKIAKLNVKEGDLVAKGSVLAKLETDALELALSQAKVAQSAAQLSLTTAQSSLTQANIALTLAQFNLDRTQIVSDILDEITDAQLELKIAQMQAEEDRKYGNSEAGPYWAFRIAQLQYAVYEKQMKLVDLLGKAEYSGEYLYLSGQKYDRLAVEDARIKQLQFTSAQQTVQQAEQNVELQKLSLDQAAKAITMAQKNLNDATIISPIDGTAVTVNVKEGELVSAADITRVPVYIADFRTFRISAQIDEIDIASVKIGQKVIIKLDAVAETQYEGKVISISLSPIANPQNTGLVVYEVKVGFVSGIPTDAKLGMSATVDIILNERSGVLLIPARAIKINAQGQSVVDVLVNNTAESRQVQLGVTDGINTEIISGLKADDVVVVNKPSTSLGMFGQ